MIILPRTYATVPIKRKDLKIAELEKEIKKIKEGK